MSYRSRNGGLQAIRNAHAREEPAVDLNPNEVIRTKMTRRAAEIGQLLISSASGGRKPREACSVAREGVVDQLPEGGRDASALVLALLHHDVDHVELRIDAEIGAAAGIPF